jgi:hypothetical protein
MYNDICYLYNTYYFVDFFTVAKIILIFTNFHIPECEHFNYIYYNNYTLFIQLHIR